LREVFREVIRIQLSGIRGKSKRKDKKKAEGRIKARGRQKGFNSLQTSVVRSQLKKKKVEGNRG